MMKLPSPYDKLANCVWLPRMLAKARLFERGQLPTEYAARFGNTGGVDSQFLAFFDIGEHELQEASALSDEQAEVWFASRVASSEARIREWNEIAVNLGRPGYPLADRFPVALQTTYRHIADQRPATIFEALVLDEK